MLYVCVLMVIVALVQYASDKGRANAGSGELGQGVG